MGFDEWDVEPRREMLDVLKHVMPQAVVTRVKEPQPATRGGRGYGVANDTRGIPNVLRPPPG